MLERETTWAEVTVGTVIQDPKLKHWLVVGEAPDANTGAPLVQISDSRKDTMWVPRRVPEAPIVVLEAADDEALSIVQKFMPGSQVLKLANDTTLPRRALRWKVAPINGKGKGARDRIRDHIDMMHSVYVNDRWADTTNPKTAKELMQAHDEMHEEATMTMSTPHHHA